MLLSRHYEVRTLDVFEKGRSLGNSLRVLWRMFRGVLWADVTFSWFAEVYALWAVRLCRIMGRRSVVVIGGYEVAHVPEIPYGSALDSEACEMVAKILSKAGRSLAVSEFVEQSALAICSDARIEVVYNAVDTVALTPSGAKSDVVVTVGGATKARWTLKGIDVFVKASKLVPSAQFVVIGPNDPEIVDDMHKLNPAVEFTGELPREGVMKRLDSAKVYCQLSRIESFGFALAEAMSFECCPVVSDQGALPEIVGKSGIVVPYGDAAAAADAIKKAIQRGRCPDARARIVENFSAEERERKLCSVIDGLVAR